MKDQRGLCRMSLAMTYTTLHAERFQKIADAITLLNIHGIISDGIANSSRRKLMKIISNCDSIVEDA